MSQSEERDNLSVMDAGSRLRLMSGTVLSLAPCSGAVTLNTRQTNSDHSQERFFSDKCSRQGGNPGHCKSNSCVGVRPYGAIKAHAVDNHYRVARPRYASNRPPIFRLTIKCCSLNPRAARGICC